MKQTEPLLPQLRTQAVVLEHNGATTRLARPLDATESSDQALLAEFLYGRGLELLGRRNGSG